MTKEEIQRVLDLSLEYYKSEVFGTNKESEKPSSERIDWIYDKIKGSSEIPNDLEEAAEISFDEAYALTGDYTNFLAKGLRENRPRPIGPHWFCEYAKNRFIAGAEWQAEKEKEYSPWLSIQGLKDAALEFGEQAKAYEIGGQSFSEDMMVAFTRGAEWQKEQMLKNAVNATVHLEPGANPVVAIGVGRFGLKVRDEVKVIVVKDL